MNNFYNVLLIAHHVLILMINVKCVLVKIEMNQLIIACNIYIYNFIDVRIIIMMFLYLNACNVQKNAQLAYNRMIIVSHAKEIIEL